MKMADLRKGQNCRVVEIVDPELMIQALRFGIGIGKMVQCANVIPLGPIIIRHNNQEIAIGRELAKAILVRPEGHGKAGSQ